MRVLLRERFFQVRTLSSSSQSEVYILAGLWALADAIWQTQVTPLPSNLSSSYYLSLSRPHIFKSPPQINSLYGCLFIKEEKVIFFICIV